VTDRAELYPVWAGLAVVYALSVGCGEQRPARVDGVYAHDSRQLVRLDCDYNGDGRIDSRTYMRNGRPIRVEADANGDGAIDRWEYYDASGALQKIGASTRRDGVEDTWVRSTGDERIVEISTRRDGVIDRREIYRGEMLQRTESDTDADGHADLWEEIEQGRVARVLIDDSQAHAGPTRQIVYRAGAEPRVEAINGENDRAAAR
jgi:hypothetical protein